MPRPQRHSKDRAIAGLYISHAIAITKIESVIAAVVAKMWTVSQAAFVDPSIIEISGTEPFSTSI